MTQMREEVFFTKGCVIVRGKTVRRGEAKKADYILYFKPGVPIAVIEAKDKHHSVGAGMQQALEYAKILDVPFAYSCNGDAFLEHDRTGSGTVIEREVVVAFSSAYTPRAIGRALKSNSPPAAASQASRPRPADRPGSVLQCSHPCRQRDTSRGRLAWHWRSWQRCAAGGQRAVRT